MFSIVSWLGNHQGGTSGISGTTGFAEPLTGVAEWLTKIQSVILFETQMGNAEMMSDNKPNKEQLLRRRDEIIADLARVNDDLRIELDRDPEEQAIELEQDEVAITMEDNLQRELADIEEQLRDIGED